MSGTSSVYHPMLDNLTARLAKIVKQIRGEARLTEANIQDALREVRVALLEADVALAVGKHFIEAGPPNPPRRGGVRQPPPGETPGRLGGPRPPAPLGRGERRRRTATAAPR